VRYIKFVLKHFYSAKLEKDFYLQLHVYCQDCQFQSVVTHDSYILFKQHTKSEIMMIS